MEKLKIAIIHDWLTNMAGSEKVVESFIKLYPDAPIYTSMAKRENLSDIFRESDIRTSFLQRYAKKKKSNHQKYLPFMPIAFERFDLNKYNIVLSSCTSCSKGVITTPDTLHICYCNTPMRYIWGFYHEYTENMNKIKKKILDYYLNYLRVWDFNAAQRVDFFIANSHNVARRIKKYYRRDAEVVYPPVNTEYFVPSTEDGEFYLCMSRLVKYKRIDIAVKAFNNLGLPLVVIGGGEQLEFLKSIANDNVKLIGHQPDSIVKEYYQKCKAFVFPGEEDFGIAPLEAQACGRPVIAFGKGGALETVVDGETGLFFYEQTECSLESSIKKFEKMSFDKAKCRENAEKFSIERFESEMKSLINIKYKEFIGDI